MERNQIRVRGYGYPVGFLRFREVILDWANSPDLTILESYGYNSIQYLKLEVLTEGWCQNMDIKKVAKDTTKVLTSYLTYQAVIIITNQLTETNPGLAIWLSDFSSRGKIQDGEAYLEELLQENQELAFRVMTVRDHLTQEVADYLPEMVRLGIQQGNMAHRRQYLERMTQLTTSETNPPD